MKCNGSKSAKWLIVVRTTLGLSGEYGHPAPGPALLCLSLLIADNPLWVGSLGGDAHRAYSLSACGWHFENGWHFETICLCTGKENGLRYSYFFIVVSLGWKQTVALCECLEVCFSLLCPDLFIKRKTHLHKKALEHRKKVHFVFLSAAPRHVGF